MPLPNIKRNMEVQNIFLQNINLSAIDFFVQFKNQRRNDLYRKSCNKSIK